MMDIIINNQLQPNEKLKYFFYLKNMSQKYRHLLNVKSINDLINYLAR